MLKNHEEYPGGRPWASRAFEQLQPFLKTSRSRSERLNGAGSTNYLVCAATDG